MSEADRSIGWGALMLIVGATILLVAAGVIPVPDDPANAPRTVIAMAGLALSSGGAALMLPPASRLRLAMVALLVTAFSVIGAWAALTGSAETIEGGLIFFSRETNALLGRILFGFGSLVSVVILVVVLRQSRNAKGGSDAGANG